MSVPDPGLEVDVSKVKAATEALQVLAHAAHMARQALQELGLSLAYDVLVETGDDDTDRLDG